MAKKIKSRIILIVVAVAAVVGIAVFFIVKFNLLNSENDAPPEIITQSTLENIIRTSNLSTFEATYNGIAKVNNAENPDEIDYYVSYEATVKAGIDFELVETDIDNEKKVITVTVPDIQINDITVDITSLDYIFENEKANTSSVSEQAYKKCIDDVTEESKKEDAIYELAEQNAHNTIKALISPFVEQLDNEFDLVIK